MNSSVFSDIIETDLKVLGFSKDNLLKIIKPLFSDVQLFSQRNISNIEQKQQGITVFRDILSKLKHNSKKILTNIDKNQNFYKLHMQKTVLRFRDKQYDVSKKIFDIDYTPISFDKSHNPQTFLLLCKK